MEKKITVYVVQSDNGCKQYFPTLSSANNAIELLTQFNVSTTLEKEKKTVVLA